MMEQMKPMDIEKRSFAIITELLADRRLLNEETLVFHPLENTASVAMREEDFFGTFLRAVCKPYTLVDMEQKGDFHA